MNRKLIRTTLAEVKERESQQREPVNNAVIVTGDGIVLPRAAVLRDRDRGGQAGGGGGGQSSQGGGRQQQQQRRAPPTDTNAEIFYYKKQMDSQTVMIIVLQDGEEIEGTIEWYDRSALKVNRQGAPNLLLLKHNIKYMFKAEDRDRENEAGG